MTFKNETLNWEELRLFLLVAEAGGLAGAARVAGVSTATFSRRMSRLEKTLGVTLFERLQTGYNLTTSGEELCAQVQEMEVQSRQIQTWSKRLESRPVVRITAGTWTSMFIARHLNDLTDTNNGSRIELLTGANFLNLSRREADLGIRNRRPEQQGLARRRIGSVSFAIYGSAQYIASNKRSTTEDRFDACEWVALAPSDATGMSSTWLHQRIGDSPRLSCNSPQSVVEASATGGGLCIVPRFIGESDSRLVCCSDPIDALTHTQWQVSHNDSRWLPHIMGVSRKLFELFRRHQALFA